MPLLSVIAFLTAAGACLVPSSPEVPTQRHAARGGALDRILLSEKSYEAGPLIFDHRLHYASDEAGGLAIACKRCHHEFAGADGDPPQACANCHYSHSDSRIRHLPSL